MTGFNTGNLKVINADLIAASIYLSLYVGLLKSPTRLLVPVIAKQVEPSWEQAVCTGNWKTILQKDFFFFFASVTSICGKMMHI
jgi:hypothetical protein